MGIQSVTPQPTPGTTTDQGNSGSASSDKSADGVKNQAAGKGSSVAEADSYQPRALPGPGGAFPSFAGADAKGAKAEGYGAPPKASPSGPEPPGAASAAAPKPPSSVTKPGPEASPLAPAGSVASKVAADVAATRAQAAKAAGVPSLDGSGRTIRLIDIDQQHGDAVKEVINHPERGIAPNAATTMSSINDFAQNPYGGGSLTSRAGWGTTVPFSSIADRVNKAGDAVRAGKATAEDRATLQLTKMVDSVEHVATYMPPGIMKAAKTAEEKATADLLNNPGNNPVAQAARMVMDTLAAQTPAEIGKHFEVSLVSELNGITKAIGSLTNPDPKIPQFVSISLGKEVGEGAGYRADLSLASPQWRQENGLPAAGERLNAAQIAQVKQVLSKRENDIVQAERTAAQSPQVAAARKALEVMIQSKLQNENMGVIVAAGNYAHHHGAGPNMYATPSAMTVASVTARAESFSPGDRTVPPYSQPGDVAAPGVFFLAQTPKVGSSASAPYVAGAAALISQAAPDLTASEVFQSIKETAAPATGQYAERAGAGVINVPAAVRRAREIQRSRSG